MDHNIKPQSKGWISTPVHLAAYAKSMRIEKKLMAQAAKEVATDLRPNSTNTDSPKTENPASLRRLKLKRVVSAVCTPIVAKGLRGDTFFSPRSRDKDSCSNSQQSKEANKKYKKDPSAKEASSSSDPSTADEPIPSRYCPPSAHFYFPDDTYSKNTCSVPVSSKVVTGSDKDASSSPDQLGNRNPSGSAFRKRLSRNTTDPLCTSSDTTTHKKQTSTKTNEASISDKAGVMHQTSMKSFPHAGLDVFISHGMDPKRLDDVKLKVQDDAMFSYVRKRTRQQIVGYACKKPNLVDKRGEFLIEMTVYEGGDPEEIPLKGNGTIEYSEPRVSYQLQLLGSQTVEQLRDALFCENDFIPLKELEHPDVVWNSKDFAKDKFKAAMLLIGNTIYSDTRYSNNIDFATKINAWASRSVDKRLGPFKSGKLSTKLKDLTIQFGYPYLYSHMAVCEHIIVFNKARLLELEDEHRLHFYPRIPSIPDLHVTVCRVDNEYLATWAVLDYDDFPESPMLVCTRCLKAFCYNKLGHKRGTFRLFPLRQLATEIPLPSQKMSRSK